MQQTFIFIPNQNYFDFQVEEILTAIDNLETDFHQQIMAESQETFLKIYLHMSANPIKFKAFGFYTINYEFLAIVRII